MQGKLKKQKNYKRKILKKGDNSYEENEKNHGINAGSDY